MSTITKERIANLIEFNSEGSDYQANAEQWEVHELARIALASLEAEAVISHLGSKNALDAIVAFIKSNRNPTLKDYNEVSKRLFQDNCHGLSNHVIEYIKQIGEELEELRSTQDTAPPAPVSDSLLSELLAIAKKAADAADECAHAEWSDDSMDHSTAIADWERRAAMLPEVK